MSGPIDRTASVRYLLDAFARPYLDDDSITEICVNRPHEVYCLSSCWQRHEVRVDQNHLESLALSVARFVGDDLSDTRPILSAILPDGERIQIVRPPACEHGTVSVTIRKPSTTILTLEQYQSQGLFDHLQPVHAALTPDESNLIAIKERGDVRNFLIEAVRLGKVMVIAGETNSGKTTLMKALMRQIPASQRIITIEDVPELFLPLHPNHVHLFYQAASADAASSEVTATALLKCSLRMNPDRIMLAELRGGETYDFLNVAASGHGGSITSCHAGSCELAFERMALMVLQNSQGQALPYAVIKRLLMLTVDVVVHMNNEMGGRGRYISEIWYEPMARRRGGSEMSV